MTDDSSELRDYSVVGVFIDQKNNFLLVEDSYKGFTQKKFPGGGAQVTDFYTDRYLNSLLPHLAEAGYTRSEIGLIVEIEKSMEKTMEERSITREFLEETGYYPEEIIFLAKEEKPDREEKGKVHIMNAFLIKRIIKPARRHEHVPAKREELFVVKDLSLTVEKFEFSSRDKDIKNTSLVVPAKEIRNTLMRSHQKWVNKILEDAEMGRKLIWEIGEETRVSK